MQNLFINIRKAEDKDLSAIKQIEQLCFHSGIWKEENII